MAKKDPYTLLKQKDSEVVESAKADSSNEFKTAVSDKAKESIPVKNNDVSFAETDSWIDLIIMILVDIVARIFGFSSPTGGKTPRKVNMPSKEEIYSKVRNKVGTELSKVGNTLEKTADYAAQSGSKILLDTTEKISSQTQELSKKGLETTIKSANTLINIAGEKVENASKDLLSQAQETYKKTLSSK